MSSSMPRMPGVGRLWFMTLAIVRAVAPISVLIALTIGFRSCREFGRPQNRLAQNSDPFRFRYNTASNQPYPETDGWRGYGGRSRGGNTAEGRPEDEEDL